MITTEVRAKYEATIGIECHVQLKTETKLFAAVGNDAREAPPNTLVSHICFGLPGALPVLNKEAIHLAVRAAFALGTEPERFSKFDRKHYFYPDLPKGYQISQYDEPIIAGGQVPIVVDGERRVINITRAHMEEDAGKSSHPAGKDYSLVDLNRAGTPLLEIVSEPEMHSGSEARAYARELYLRMKYADVSDCNLYYGNMRFDVNVSVSTTDELGTRSETKNLNSFRIVEKAVDYEVSRQIELLEKGQSITQETRGWDDAKQKTFSMRSKENADDYRYMPDPDIPPVVLADDYVAGIKAEMPVLPDIWRERLAAYGLDGARTETLLSAQVDIGIDYLGAIASVAEENKAAATFVANYLINRDIKKRQELQEASDAARAMLHSRLPSPEQFIIVFDMYSQKQLSSNSVDELLWELGAADDSGLVPADYAKERGYIQVSDEGEIAKIVAQILSENPKAAQDVKQGEMKAIGFLVGQVMKASKGQANPQLAQELIRKQLNET